MLVRDALFMCDLEKSGALKNLEWEVAPQNMRAWLTPEAGAKLIATGGDRKIKYCGIVLQFNQYEIIAWTGKRNLAQLPKFNGDVTQHWVAYYKEKQKHIQKALYEIGRL